MPYLPSPQSDKELSMLSINTRSPVTHFQYRKELTKKIVASQKQVRETVASTGSAIVHHTQARNIKAPATLEDEKHEHEDIMLILQPFNGQ
jgi:uncharacterized membrane-anchored protein YhcB (DUF1043 family)